MPRIKRLSAIFNTTRDGLNNGLIAGAIMVFLILIGLPGGLEEEKSLAALSLPLFVLVTIALAIFTVRQAGEKAKWSYLLGNGVALGIGAALVLLLFMGFINRWQARGFKVEDYFFRVRLETTSRLSGVNVSELFANPEIDPTTQALPEGAILRTNPMTLSVNNDDMVVYNLGFIKVGGLYSTALGLFIVGLLTIVIYRGLTLVDWAQMRHRLDGYFSATEGRRTFANRLPILGQWLRLALPLLFFALFILTTSLNYDVGFWRTILGDSTIDNMPQGRKTIIDLGEIFDIRRQPRQNLQLIIVFSMIISLLVAWRSIRNEVKREVPLVVRASILSGLIYSFLGLALWQTVGDNVSFISPTIGLFNLDQIEPSAASAWIVILLTLVVQVLIFRHIMDGQKFESLLVGVIGIGVLGVLPLYMDQYQTAVVNRVAISIILGLGLNIVVGYAGLLDLGYVAFYAIGAYTYAFVESEKQHLSDNRGNSLAFMVITAAFVVPLIIGGASYYWGQQRRLATHSTDESEDGSQEKIRGMAPLWKDQPPLWASLLLVIVAVGVTFGANELLQQMGIFEGVYRASPFLIALLLALLASGFTGVLLGFPVLRLRSDYLAIVTLGFGEIISIAIVNLQDITGGSQGVGDIPRPLPSGASIAEANLVILYLALLGAGLVTVISLRLRSSRLGRAWTALRSDEDIAQAMGINLVNAKLLAFSIGASFAGVAGLLFAARESFLGPRSFDLQVSINVLALVIIGGMGSVPGVIIGAIVLIGLPDMLRVIQDYRTLVFGGLLVAMMLIRPGGLMPTPLASLEERARQLRQRRAGESKAVADEDQA